MAAKTSICVCCTEYFDLGQNDLNGTLPSEIGLMTELESLVLSGNGFFGALPSELGQLTRLLGLFLDKNNFNGRLPENVFKMKRIGE